MEIQSIYQQAIKFAALKHAEQNQTIPGTNIPYVIHLSNVAMEILIAYEHSTDFKLELALPIALLHDALEDTTATFEEISTQFGLDVAHGVAALTKNAALAKEEKMIDSLQRIRNLPKEIWAVKLADRITNLQKPPHHWSSNKKQEYKQEALQILEHLKSSNDYLEKRLSNKIKEYEQYL